MTEVGKRYRIALTHPTSWPWVRRGSERLLHDLSHAFAASGHDVTVISSSPEHAHIRQDGPVRQILLPQRLRRLRGLRQLNGFHAFALDCRDAVSEGAYDVVYCLNYHDAYGALAAARRSTKPVRVVYHLTGIPVRRYFRRTPLDGWMFRRVIDRADAVAVLSTFARAKLLADYGREGALLPSPTRIEAFARKRAATSGPPRILFVGDAEEPRKGALLLAKAFVALRSDGEAATLHFSGRCGDARRQAILSVVPPALRQDVIFHGVGAVEDLPDLYASAAVLAHPAIWEALGIVLVEALASGAPVVGCAHAGVPDIIDDPAIGALFDPGPIGEAATNVAGLAAALREVLALSRKPETASCCRAHARRFGWNALSAHYEAFLDAA